MYFNCTATNPSRERCSVPFSCCLHDANQTVINTMCGHGMQDKGYLEASAFIYTNGCIDKLVNWIHSNLFLLGGITLGLALPQVRGSPGTGGEKGSSHSSTLCSISFGSCLKDVVNCNPGGCPGRILGEGTVQMLGTGGTGVTVPGVPQHLLLTFLFFTLSSSSFSL
ncbi:tetraspanin-33-like, partial [Neopelma chrysocephalum]|uniref:tetraspanin-33-like n=1 Tax=Neopelma chrysocephalum TaxID=114329 RepID=UPI000FCD0E0D